MDELIIHAIKGDVFSTKRDMNFREIVENTPLFCLRPAAEEPIRMFNLNMPAPVRLTLPFPLKLEKSFEAEILQCRDYSPDIYGQLRFRVYLIYRPWDMLSNEAVMYDMADLPPDGGEKDAIPIFNYRIPDEEPDYLMPKEVREKFDGRGRLK